MLGGEGWAQDVGATLSGVETVGFTSDAQAGVLPGVSRGPLYAAARDEFQADRLACDGCRLLPQRVGIVAARHCTGGKRGA